MNIKISISVIIPTLERKQYIVASVKALLPQLRGMDAEVIVVDQSSADVYADIVKAFADEPLVQVIHFLPPSLPAARNEGIRRAKGDIILFLDDDIVPCPTLVSAHLEAFADPTVGAAAGRVIDRGKRFNNSRLPGASVTWWGRFRRNFDYPHAADIKALPGGNMSFRRSVINCVGAFDVLYRGTATFEDTDYGYRVRKLGFRIRYIPEAVIVHLIAPAGGCRICNVLQRESNNVYNMTHFFLKHYSIFLIPLFVLVNGAVFFRRVFGHASLTGAMRAFVEAFYAACRTTKRERP